LCQIDDTGTNDVRFQLLPSSFDDSGKPSPRQHLACFIVNDKVAFDAGSLAMSCSDRQRDTVRDIILTHAHLDHIAGLPLFVDDLYSTLTEPIRIHADQEVIDVLERDIFNWSVYPRFSELSNENGPVMEYRPFTAGKPFKIAGLTVVAASVNHRVPSSGFIISDGKSSVAMSGDTAQMDGFWDSVNAGPRLSALLIECAMPNQMRALAEMSHHLTPDTLAEELKKFHQANCPIFVINIKPRFREDVIDQLSGLPRVEVFEVSRTYDW
jgi:cAMP phosphodiesterase